MKITTITALLIALSAAAPALADDQGNANAEQQTQPTPNRGGTSGGPAHDVRPGEAGTVRSGERTGHDGRHSTETAPQNARGR
ncbi:hypothetical protein [Methylobacterium sp. WCS2018Hpa-22]|uniref:hypothetical protein n=1 Tax=Methylobacterium sp. WCS2018Hpa-22 TaxID=3073633 RepID=UPI002889BB91|nr:hypothetical protein [Methylobacterium sp. WCS2018Hpa-22]